MKTLRRLGPLALVIALTACNQDEVGKFEVFVAGENEVCPGGDCGGQGYGQASIDIDLEQGRLCYDLDLTDIPDPTALHIHRAPLPQTGDIVVDLAWDGDPSGGARCLDGLDGTVLERIVLEPRLHYLNVHSQQYPDGAARGHLAT